MLLIKQNGFYVINNSKGQYYTILENGKPDEIHYRMLIIGEEKTEPKITLLL